MNNVFIEWIYMDGKQTSFSFFLYSNQSNIYFQFEIIELKNNSNG